MDEAGAYLLDATGWLGLSAPTLLVLVLGLAGALALALAWLTARSRALRCEAVEQVRRIRSELQEAQRQETVMREVALHASDGIVYTDMTARIIWANPTYCRTMGYELSEIVGRKPQEFCFPPELKPSEEEISNFVYDLDSDDFGQLKRRLNIRKNGERFWQEISSSMIEPSPGERRVILVSRDVTAQVHREEELEQVRAGLQNAAHHDALTGLKNRYAFLKAIDARLGTTDRRKPPIGLLYIDLDKFKAINDSHGHAAGDAVLNHVADTIRSSVRRSDLACRLGGDEFLVACPGVGDFATLEMIADTLIEELAQPFLWHDMKLKCGASVGLAISDPAIKTAEDLIRLADFALYEAKAPGAPRILRYDAALHDRKEAERLLMEEFVEALDADAIGFVYQPVLDAENGKITSFETLARWQRADGTMLTPDRFLGFAKKLNRLAEVDFAAIRATARLTAELKSRGHPIRGAFNTSAEALAHPKFTEHLMAAARASGVTSDDLTVEVLETTIFGPDTSDSLAAARISELRRMGFSVYLDDFGVGYAGLVHLGQLDISGIKLDRSLVANICTDRSARIIATSILRMCRELGVNSLAEGIEIAEQADFLVAHGCARLQGFGIARPMPRTDLIALIDAGAPVRLPSGAPSAKRRA